MSRKGLRHRHIITLAKLSYLTFSLIQGLISSKVMTILKIMHILMVESVVSIKEARNKAGESVFMAAAKHGNTHVFNMLTDIGSASGPL